MKFLIDANCPYSLKAIFEKHGFIVKHVRDIAGLVTDEEIFEYSIKNELIIVTRDLGFAEMCIKGRGMGLVLIRLPYYFTADKINRFFDGFLGVVDINLFLNHIAVVELDRYRVKSIE